VSVATRRLRERHFGIFEGKRDLSAILARYTLDESYIDKYEGVEPLRELQDRTSEILTEPLDSGYKTILIVAHGVLDRALHRAASKTPNSGVSVRYKNAEIHQLI
jgi:broad specificity phosphatase PhoE